MAGQQQPIERLENTFTEQQSAHQRATLTAKEAADMLGISYWLILELVKRKEIPAIHCGKRVLFRADSLTRWMELQEAKNMNPKQSEPGKLRIVGQ